MCSYERCPFAVDELAPHHVCPIKARFLDALALRSDLDDHAQYPSASPSTIMCASKHTMIILAKYQDTIDL